MKRIIPAIALLLLLAGMTHAQSTTVSVQTTDAASQSWNNGTFQFSFQPNPQFPGQYNWTGGTLPLNISGVINSTGGFSVSVPSNTAITPQGSSWNLQVCSQATSPCFTTNNVTIAGTTQSFTITPPAIQISLINPPASPMLAYSDSEISSAQIGSYYYQIPIQNYRFCQAVTGPLCTLWNTFGGGPPPTGFPRLDQVLNQNVGKTFNQGGAAIGFTAGPGLNLSGETSPLTVPVIVSCTTAAAGQICDDGTNYHIFVNGVDTLLVFSSSSIGSGNNGDVVGYKVAAGQVSLQDLGPVDTATGNSFININNTSPLDGDLSCWNAFGPPFWVNCTPGAVDTSVNGASNAYTISFSDQLTTIDHDVAGSASVTVTLPTAITLGLNPGFVFVWSNHSTHADSIAPTTWTINGSATLSVAANTFCRVRVDPNSATNWIADCANTSSGGTVTSVTGTSPIVSSGGSTPAISCPTCVTSTGISGMTAGQVPVAATATTITSSVAASTTVNGATCALGSTCNSGHHGISFSIGIPGGTALTVASTTTDYITVPFACTINAYNLAIDAGTITVKFWKVATGTAIPTSANSINTSGVSISSGTAIHSTTLTDFTTTAVAASDILAMNVTAVATAAYVNGVLSCQE